MEQNIYRHGDLLLKQIDAIPNAAKLKHDNVLALGETTGHKHVLKSKQLMVYELDNRKFISVQKSTELIHEEHNTLVLEPGNYVVLQEREFDPVAQEIRQVLD